MSENNNEQGINDEETRGRDTSKHGSHLTTPPKSVTTDEEEQTEANYKEE